MIASLIQFKCTKYFRDDLTLVFEVTQPDYECNSEIGMLKLKFERFAARVSNKLTDLSDEVRSIKESKPYSIVVLEGVIRQ